MLSDCVFRMRNSLVSAIRLPMVTKQLSGALLNSGGAGEKGTHRGTLVGGDPRRRGSVQWGKWEEGELVLEEAR